ncbi:hypothetical protein ACFOEY_10015 [Paracandidimonas soli]|uniref:hypothetical protein n=1 Tax=Paracandidimonas soli TaxID=1917182 RepID=UPI00360B2BDA
MWHRQGTISVANGSATVTGSGTAWVANIRVGDALQGPDGRLYEVTNVASNTALSITPPYLGPNASGQSYWIVPVQGYVKRSADRLAAITDEIGGLPSQVQTNTDNIAANTADIAANTADIAANTDDIAANTDDIAANDVRIANAIQEISDLEAAALLKADNL